VTEFIQLLFSGIATGSIYGLIALGFVVIYKATGTFNFAQGGFVLLGAYVTYQFAVAWEIPFGISFLAAMLCLALIAAGLERLVMRRMVGKPAFTVPIIWDLPGYTLNTPWTGDTTTIGDVTISHVDIATIVLAAVVFGIFFLFFNYTRTGTGMRAAAFDQEAAAAQGISVSRSFLISWAIAGAVGVVAGVMLVAESGSLSPAIGFAALAAFPAMILGGLDSPGGAVVGGVLIGVAEVMTRRYLDVDWLGADFASVLPYLILILVLLIRPTGLFGTRMVERV
jgi:branched-chain amino acid transport system permease protein